MKNLSFVVDRTIANFYIFKFISSRNRRYRMEIVCNLENWKFWDKESPPINSISYNWIHLQLSSLIVVSYRT